MTRHLSLDIEATPTTEPPQFDDASAWEPFAIALSFRSAVEPMPETAVFIRQDGSDDAERKLLAAVANWIHERRPADALFTFNGGKLRADADGFDLPILAHRIETVLSGDLADYVRAAFDVRHRDLFAELVDRRPDGEKYPSLDEALAEHDLAKATPTLGGEDVDGSMMPAFGDAILAGDGLSQRERRVLTEYASSDVRPLGPLSERIAEADAVTDGGRR